MAFRSFPTDRPALWTKAMTRHTAPGMGAIQRSVGSPSSSFAQVDQLGGIAGGPSQMMAASRALISSSRAGNNLILSVDGISESVAAGVGKQQMGVAKSDVDNQSMRSRTLSRYPAVGHALRGPMLVQMATHYLCFLLVLFSAYQTGWASEIRFYMCYFYFCATVMMLQISRMAYAADPNSVVPFYLSLIPFTLLLFISREAHQIVMVLWYASLLVINLQSGHPAMQRHLFYYSAACVVAYIMSTVGMAWFYQPSCTQVFCGVALTVPISPSNEAVLLAGCAQVVMCVVMLERFIKMNAQTLLNREHYMTQLYAANIDLKRRLRLAKSDKE
ncbi:hypothetical protein BDK51DRAFT_43725, partial [Blyttiomyces helicus]